MIDLDRIEAIAKKAPFGPYGYEGRRMRVLTLSAENALAMVAAIRAAQQVVTEYHSEQAANPIYQLQLALSPFTDSESVPS